MGFYYWDETNQQPRYKFKIYSEEGKENKNYERIIYILDTNDMDHNLTVQDLFNHYENIFHQQYNNWNEPLIYHFSKKTKENIDESTQSIEKFYIDNMTLYEVDN